MSAVRRPSWIRLAVIGIAVVALMAGGCGQGVAPVGPAGQSTLAANPTEGPLVTVGGYTFGSTSNRLNHSFLKANPTTPNWLYTGTGTVGWARACIFSDGGLVKGIKTLRVDMNDTGPGQPVGGWFEAWWLAQDTQGNIHHLKHQVIRNDNGQKEPAFLLGVAAGGPVAFLLPRSSQLTLGRTWYWSFGGKVAYQCTITSLAGRISGKSGLLVVRGIYDANGDGTFNPNWTGPDRRDDFWYQPSFGWLYFQHRSNAGVLRQ